MLASCTDSRIILSAKGSIAFPSFLGWVAIAFTAILLAKVDIHHRQKLKLLRTPFWGTVADDFFTCPFFLLSRVASKIRDPPLHRPAYFRLQVPLKWWRLSSLPFSLMQALLFRSVYCQFRTIHQPDHGLIAILSCFIYTAGIRVKWASWNRLSGAAATMQLSREWCIIQPRRIQRRSLSTQIPSVASTAQNGYIGI